MPFYHVYFKAQRGLSTSEHRGVMESKYPIEFDSDISGAQEWAAKQVGAESTLLISWHELKGYVRPEESTPVFTSDAAIRASTLAVLLLEEHLIDSKLSLRPSAKANVIKLISESCKSIAENDWVFHIRETLKKAVNIEWPERTP